MGSIITDSLEDEFKFYSVQDKIENAKRILTVLETEVSSLEDHPSNRIMTQIMSSLISLSHRLEVIVYQLEDGL